MGYYCGTSDRAIFGEMWKTETLDQGINLMKEAEINEPSNRSLKESPTGRLEA